MTPLDLVRLLGPPLAAVLAVLWLGREAERRHLLPPALVREPWRRVAVAVLLAGTFWLGVFLPLGGIGIEAPAFDPEGVRTERLFALHGLLVLSLVLTFVLAFPGQGVASFARRLGLRPSGAWREIGLGLGVGVAVWGAVIALLVALAVALAALGLEDWLPRQAPAVVPWIAGLPVTVRLLLSLSAGVVEEAFFRGFLQPRAGVVFSTVCFVVAHLTYQQPFMLLGVTLLSLVYAGLVVWRRSVWAAATAHFVFDAVQLLVLIPAVLKQLPEGAGPGP